MEKLAGFEIVLSMRERTPLPASLINRLPRLRMLGITGSYNRSLDTAACTAQSVVVCNTVGQRRRRGRHRRVGAGPAAGRSTCHSAADANMRAGRFQEGLPVGISLAGKTIGIIGLGHLGSQMARYCQALHMNVLAWSQNLTAEKAQAAGATLAPKAELLSRSDAVSIHMVLSPRSRGLIGAADLALMKPGSNPHQYFTRPHCGRSRTSRGRAVWRASSPLFDVFDREPLPAKHPLRNASNTILTPHLGYGVRETWTEFYGQSVEKRARLSRRTTDPRYESRSACMMP